jgi:HK97 family phage major capsid protein
MVNVNDLKKQKAEHKSAAEKLVKAAIEAGNDLAGAELTQYDNHVTEIKKIESLLARHAELAAFTVDESIDNGNPLVLQPGTNDENPVNPRASKEYRKAFWSYIRSGANGFSREILAALNITTGSQGGYATETIFDHNLVEKLVNANVMRQLADVITTTSDRKIVVENTVGSAGWTAEAAVAHNDDGSDDDSLAQVSISSYKLSRIVKVSEELLQDEFFDIQGWLARKYANAFGIAEETAFVNGTGSAQPLGVVRSASAGTTFHLHNDIATDEIFDLYHSLKRAYRSNASFLLNDSTVLMLRKKKDAQGRYIWQDGIAGTRPDTLVGRPAFVSDAMPTADNAGNKSVLFGDFKYYVIADRSPRSFLRLNELYAANGQIGFRGVERTDGKLTLSEAVVYGAMGAAS